MRPVLAPCYAALNLLLVVVCGATTRADEPKTLRWRLEPQSKYRVTLVQKVETETTFGGKPLKLGYQATMVKNWLVTAVDEQGTATIELSFERIAVRSELPPADAVEYDSASARTPTGEAKQLATAIQPFLGAKFTAKLASHGEWVDYQPSPELAESLAKLDDQSPLKKLFARDGVREMFRQGFLLCSTEPVAAGGEWSHSTETTTGIGRVKQSTTYRYEGPDTPAAGALDKVSATTRIEWNSAPSGSASRELKRQRQTATYRFDSTQGHLVDSDVNQQLTTESRVRGTLIETQLTSSLRVKFERLTTK